MVVTFPILERKVGAETINGEITSDTSRFHLEKVTKVIDGCEAVIDTKYFAVLNQQQYTVEISERTYIALQGIEYSKVIN